MTRAALDDIFAKAKKPNTSVGKSTTVKVATGVAKIGTVRGPASKSKTTSKEKTLGTSSDPFGLTARGTTRSNDVTEEGWKIYTPAELNIGKGGDTAECPFDCSCCF